MDTSLTKRNAPVVEGSELAGARSSPTHLEVHQKDTHIYIYIYTPPQHRNSILFRVCVVVLLLCCCCVVVLLLLLLLLLLCCCVVVLLLCCCVAQKGGPLDQPKKCILELLFRLET